MNNQTNIETLIRSDRLPEAEFQLRTAIAANPRDPGLRATLARLARLAERPLEAEAAACAAVWLDPANPVRWTALIEDRRQAGHAAAAEALARTMLRQFPDDPGAHNALGMAQHDLGRMAEAENSFRGALRHNPGFTPAWINLGLVRQKRGAPAEAEACYRTAVAQGADAAAVGCNLGLALLEQGRVADAEIACRSAVDAGNGLARVNLAMILLLTGRLHDGWAAYEARLALDPWDEPAPRLTSLAGVRGRTVLVRAEQGFGDTLQFCRYVPLLAQLGATVILQVPAPLVRLLSGLPAQVVAEETPVTAVDTCCRLMSLPYLFDTTLATIPAAVPYLAAPDDAVAAWRSRLAECPGVKVGLVWAGGVRDTDGHAGAIDRRRSLPLAALAPLADVPDCTLVSLQVGPPATQIGQPGTLPVIDPTGRLRDFADTAALIAALDLVIAVDTAVAHLAGALGRPVWLLNRFDTCWRWLRDRDDSPWYPTLRQFRQPAPGDWASVVTRVGAALAERVAHGAALLA